MMETSRAASQMQMYASCKGLGHRSGCFTVERYTMKPSINSRRMLVSAFMRAYSGHSRSQCRVHVAAASSAGSFSPASIPQQGPGRHSAAALLGVMATIWRAVVSALQKAAQQMQQRDPAVINSSIKQSVRHFHMLGAIAPFAAASSGANTFLLLTKAMAKFLKIYLLLLFLRVLLSWFPAFNWERQPWLALRQMTDPYLNLYRGLVPPLLGTIDFTPLLGFFILQYLSGVLESGASEDELDEWW